MAYSIGLVFVSLSAALFLLCTGQPTTDQRLLVSSRCELNQEQQVLTFEPLLQRQYQTQLQQQREIHQMKQLLQQIHDETLKIKQLNGHDCSDIKRVKPWAENGIYTIVGNGSLHLDVYCDMTTSGGGWTVFQRRKDGSQDFKNISWESYAAGFGRLTGEFWLGNDHIATLVATKPYRLRIDMEMWNGTKYYAEYSHFNMGDRSTNFLLRSLGNYTGTSGDSLMYHVGNKFSTFDRDNDAANKDNCAAACFGAWWYKGGGGQSCQHSNLNGEFNNQRVLEGINWYHLTGQSLSLKFVEMKIRPANV